MKRIFSILVLGVAIVAGLGCAGEPKEPEPPAKTEAEIAAEAEVARRAAETTALSDRAAQLNNAIDQIGGDGGAEMPAALEATLSQVEEAQDGVERLLAELGQASGDGWEAARSRLDAALSDLEATKNGATTAVSDWQARVAAALAMRESGGTRIDPKTGLIQGLDGGDYGQYLPSAIERVQQRLRDMARYAGPVDGHLGAATMQAIGEFQKEQELQVSGVPSPMTRSRLFAAEG